MTPAQEHILALVSGLPSCIRNLRLVAMLQAFFDGSTEAGQALIVAGYLAPVETWLRFSDDWAALRAHSSRPFKMKNYSRSIRRMDRAMLHYGAIKRAGLVGIGCAIPMMPLKKVVKEMNLEPSLANPYYLAWRTVITASLEGSKLLGSREPIDFVFDDQSEKTNILKAWEYFHSGAPASARKRIKGISFKDDEDLKPLQAADMIAWWAREQYLKDKTHMGRLFPPQWTDGREATLYFVELPEKGMRDQFTRDLVITKARQSDFSLRASFKLSAW